MADPITNAKLERSRLEAEIEALRAKLNKVDGFIEMYNVFAGTQTLDMSSRPAPPPLPPLKQMESAKRLTIADRVALLLSDGLPRKPHELLQELEADGSLIGSGDEGRRITNLSSQLSRDKARFQSSRKFGWSLKQQPKPQMESPSPIDVDDGLND